MAKVSELYTVYLKPRHLPNGGEVREVTIEQATIEQLHPRPGQTSEAIVLSFVGKPNRLILNQGNANRMIDIAGDDTSAWPGVVIGVKRGKWGNHDTIIIVASQVTQPTHPPAAPAHATAGATTKGTNR